MGVIAFLKAFLLVITYSLKSVKLTSVNIIEKKNCVKEKKNNYNL